MGLLMEIVEATTYAMFALDLLDAGLDYGFVAELAKNDETKRHAAWLGVCTTIALLMEVILKIAIQRNKRESTKENKDAADGTAFNVNSKTGRAAFILFCALMELCIFFVEDATTLFVWWQTGLYLDNANEADGLSKANLYITVASAIMAIVGLFYGVFRFLKETDYLCEPGALLFLEIPAFFILGILVFWAWFALQVILPGESYGCLGTCNNITAALLGGADGGGGGGGGVGGVARRDGAASAAVAADQQDAVYAAVAALLNLDTANFDIPAALAQFQADYGILTTTTTMTLMAAAADAAGDGQVEEGPQAGDDVTSAAPADLDGFGSGEADLSAALDDQAELLFSGNSQSMNKGVIAASGCSLVDIVR
eukprot:gene1038-18920_t